MVLKDSNSRTPGNEHKGPHVQEETPDYCELKMKLILLLGVVAKCGILFEKEIASLMVDNQALVCC